MRRKMRGLSDFDDLAGLVFAGAYGVGFVGVDVHGGGVGGAYAANYVA